MNHTLAHPRKRRFGAILTGIALSAGVVAGTSSVASAETSLSVTVAEEFGLDKVSSQLVIDGYTAIISKLPAQAATSEQAIAVKDAKPVLTCTVGLGSATPSTYTSTGEYISLDGELVLHFGFENEPSAATDSCVLSATPYVKATGTTTYPLSTVGRTVQWGDSAKVEKAVKNRLKALTPKLRSSFAGNWGNDFVARLNKSISSYKFRHAVLPFEATSTSAKVAYVLRPSNHGAHWINVCQRVIDSRLICMRYHPRFNTVKYFTVYSSNFYLQELTTETAS